MYLSRIGVGGSAQNGWGVLCQCGVYIGSNPSLFGVIFCATAYFITRADSLLRLRIFLLRVRIFYYNCGYRFDLTLCKKIVLMF